MNYDNRNTGHGHVNPRPDGVKARCGGPGFCKVCSAEKAQAIAPPVAAGSVDKGKIDDLLVALSIAAVDVSRGGHPDIHRDAALELINAIDTWGAQQHYAGVESGRKEYADSFVYWRQRAEKAEARVKELDTGRHAPQAEGTHPAPCARHCEANAYQIEVRRLEAVELDLHRKLAAEKLRADQGWARYEAANRVKNDLERQKAGSGGGAYTAQQMLDDALKQYGL